MNERLSSVQAALGGLYVHRPDFAGGCASTLADLSAQRSAAAMIYLSGSSDVTQRGTLIFSSRQAAAIEVRADDAFIRPAADVATVGQIIIAGPKKLSIYARRGPLIFLYHDESEVIAEGQSYRVLLDPAEDDPSAKPDETPAKRPARRRRGFLFFLLVPWRLRLQLAVAPHRWKARTIPNTSRNKLRLGSRSPRRSYLTFSV